jgi:hypothetical protein
MSSAFDKIMSYDTANRIVYNSLCKEMKKGEGVLPFVGAGLSAFAYDTWEQLLIKLSSDLSNKDKKSIQKAVKVGDYFTASDLLCEKYGETLFYNELRDVFSEDKIDDDELKKSAAYLIPKLCQGDCITTNFDRVLEHACRLNNIVPDRAIPTDTNQLNEYLRNGNKKSALVFKIHGDILSNKDDIIVTGKSYNEHYGIDTPLRKQLTRWIDSRKLLFLGASLKQDRTVDIIKERMEEGMYNYTIYGCKQYDIPLLKQHFEEMNTMAIFYDSSDHKNLKTILLKLIKDTET